MQGFKARAFGKAISIWLVFQALLFAGVSITSMLPMWALAIIVGSLLCLVMIFLTSLYLRSDGLTMRDIGMALPSGAALKLFVSFVAGMAFFGSFYAAYLLVTPVALVAVSQPDLLTATAISLAVFVALGSMEEIVFRGYFLRKMGAAIGIRGGIYLTSLAFGLYHGLSTESLTGPAIWGLLYAVCAYWSNGLVVPIGFHVGVNYIQALFSGKEKWVPGIWTVELTEAPTIFTVSQLSLGLNVLILLLGVSLVEYYLRVIRPRQKDQDSAA